MASATRVTITYQDRYNNSCRVVFHVSADVIDPTASPIPAVIAAINYFTCAVGLTVELSKVKAIADTPGTTAYANVEDKVVASFRDAVAAPHNWRICGIKPALLQADKETLDITNATVIAWTAAIIANASGSNGEAISSFTGGHRTISRKLNKY